MVFGAEGRELAVETAVDCAADGEGNAAGAVVGARAVVPDAGVRTRTTPVSACRRPGRAPPGPGRSRRRRWKRRSTAWRERCAHCCGCRNCRAGRSRCGCPGRRTSPARCCAGRRQWACRRTRRRRSTSSGRSAACPRPGGRWCPSRPSPGPRRPWPARGAVDAAEGLQGLPPRRLVLHVGHQAVGLQVAPPRLRERPWTPLPWEGRGQSSRR